MANEKIRFTLPAARIVSGSVDKGRDKDADGKPLLIKSGPKAGQPTIEFYIAVAVPKNAGETHWAQTAWGQQVWAVGHAAFPGIAQSPNFSWKIEDGDSQIPNSRGHKPCDREGYKGCWILHMKQAYAIPCVNYRESGKAPIDPKIIKRGYVVEVAVTCQGNSSTQTPGVYLNPELVNFMAIGPEISSGPDADAAGFSTGATAVPAWVAALQAQAMAQGSMAGATPAPTPLQLPTPSPPAFPVLGAAAPAIPGFPAPAAAIPPSFNPGPGDVPANPAILAGVPLPGAPVPPPAAPAGPVLTAKALATGQPYAALIAGGWTDAALRANGYIV